MTAPGLTGQGGLSSQDITRKVSKAGSRVERAAWQAAELERIAGLGADATMSRLDAQVSRDKLVRDLRKVHRTRPVVPESAEDLKAQLVRILHDARSLVERLNLLTFDALPAIRPAQVENATSRVAMRPAAMCDALSQYVGFDVVFEVEWELDHGSTIREITHWLRGEGAPDDLSRYDVIRIATMARDLRRQERARDREDTAWARWKQADQEAAIRDVLRDATRPAGTSRIDPSRAKNVHQVRGGLPTLGKRR